ncbi:MAG: sulfite exporter TauE/SafE family protein [Proteobacteria bacterium]|jgi:uncharacterized protein|nr:sulfite exporter TauE/SafE family protein [Pseudomonadota bacterium]
MIITDPTFYYVAVPAVLITGMGKGGLGGNAGAVAVPLMALVIEPIRAAAILLPIICLMDLLAVRTFWGIFDAASLKIIIPASMIGVAIGSTVLGLVSTEVLKALIGIISISFALNYWLVGDRLGKAATSKVSGWICGAVAGFTSLQIHAGAPPLSIYLLPKRLDKYVLLGTMAVFFAILDYVKLIPYALLGQLDSSNLYTSLVLAPLAPIGVKLGYYVLERTSQLVIYRLIYFFLFVAGLKLVWDVVLA